MRGAAQPRSFRRLPEPPLVAESFSHDGLTPEHSLPLKRRVWDACDTASCKAVTAADQRSPRQLLGRFGVAFFTHWQGVIRRKWISASSCPHSAALGRSAC